MRNSRVAIVFAALAFRLGSPSLAAPAAAALPEDLQLDRYPAFELRTDPVPNPHASLPCERCHVKSGQTYEVARRFGLRLPLVTEGENPVLLCERCHPGEHRAHPGNFRLERDLPPSALEVFPILQVAEGYERVTCTTCHLVHFPHTANRLLRGFPVKERTAGARFATRLEFCAACHGADGVAALSGHAGGDVARACQGCHEPPDIAGRIGAPGRGLNAACSTCHPAEPGTPRHFYAYNAFPEIGRDDLPAYGVALEGGRFTCATCHVHHREPGNGGYFKPGFVAAVSRSVRVNPHESARLCVTCHPVTPDPPGTAGAVAPLVEEDRTRLCRRCHAREGALQMRHPLGAPSARAPVPEGWPLRRDGSLGCETCHLAGHAPRDPANPRFLRGGPYAARNAVCFRCHAEEAYRGRNPHAPPLASGCELCHEVSERGAANPEGKVGPVLAEANLLCLRCHVPARHPAGHEHTVFLRERGFLAIDRERIPISLGKVTCHSCHDSHAPSGGRLLRTASTALICPSCHPF